jgi:hypothetical protein
MTNTVRTATSLVVHRLSGSHDSARGPQYRTLCGQAITQATAFVNDAETVTCGRCQKRAERWGQSSAFDAQRDADQALERRA